MISLICSRSLPIATPTGEWVLALKKLWENQKKSRTMPVDNTTGAASDSGTSPEENRIAASTNSVVSGTSASGNVDVVVDVDKDRNSEDGHATETAAAPAANVEGQGMAAVDESKIDRTNEIAEQSNSNSNSNSNSSTNAQCDDAESPPTSSAANEPDQPEADDDGQLPAALVAEIAAAARTRATLLAAQSEMLHSELAAQRDEAAQIETELAERRLRVRELEQAHADIASELRSAKAAEAERTADEQRARTAEDKASTEAQQAKTDVERKRAALVAARREHKATVAAERAALEKIERLEAELVRAKEVFCCLFFAILSRFRLLTLFLIFDPSIYFRSILSIGIPQIERCCSRACGKCTKSTRRCERG